MDEKPNYYAIIPADVRYDKRLAPNAKLLYGEITALCNQEGFCWASDTYFAKLYNLRRETINVLIGSLRELGYMTIETTIENNVKKRKIFIKNPPLESEKNLTGGVRKNAQGVLEKSNINNTSINNTINNNVELNNLHEEICSIFNRNSNSYKLTDKRKKMLKSRLKDTGRENIISACKSIKKSEFHMGKNDRGWVADPYWCLSSYEKAEEWSNKTIVKPKASIEYKTPDEIFPQEVRVANQNKIQEIREKIFGGRNG
jgi:hypothetical protein